MKKKMNMVATAITLSEKEIQKIKENADKYGISFSEMLRRIVDEHYEKQEENK